MDDKLFKILYNSLVRPHVEFANQVWGPHLVKHIVMLENVQKRATKLIPGMKELSYEERLKNWIYQHYNIEEFVVISLKHIRYQLGNTTQMSHQYYHLITTRSAEDIRKIFINEDHI